MARGEAGTRTFRCCHHNPSAGRATDIVVLNAVAEHLGRLRHADLIAVSHPEPVNPGLDSPGRRQAVRDALNARKRDLTALSSARWAHAIIAANDTQCKVARAAQDRHIAGLRAAIAAIAKRLSQPTVDTPAPPSRAGWPTATPRRLAAPGPRRR